MKLSADTEEVLAFLDYTSGNSLRKRDDVGVLLETGASYGNPDLINDIIFYGAYLWNLSQTIRKSGREAEGLDKLHAEFRRIGDEMRSYLTQFIDSADADVKERFRTVYLQLNAGAFRNLVDLSHDLAELKTLQNTLKNRK